MHKDVISKLRAFNRFYTSIIGVANNHILESDYSLTEVRVMYEIYYTPGITARRLKEIIQVDEGYLSRLICRLQNKKLISKKQSKEDNRFYSLTLSAKGEKIFLSLDKRSSDASAGIIQHLGKAKQAELIQLLDKVKTLLTKNSL
jgi:DNA-binding MarR family transcriptional regulator